MLSVRARRLINSANASRSWAGWWTDERVSELRRLWSERRMVADIARALHTTPNAVIGKANRLGLQPFSQDEMTAHRVISARASSIRVPRETQSASA